MPAVKKDKSAKPKRAKVKADPRHVAAARELRDRYLEQFNAGGGADSAKGLGSGKYEVAKAIEARPVAMLLEQAA